MRQGFGQTCWTTWVPSRWTHAAWSLSGRRVASRGFQCLAAREDVSDSLSQLEHLRKRKAILHPAIILLFRCFKLAEPCFACIWSMMGPMSHMISEPMLQDEGNRIFTFNVLVWTESGIVFFLGGKNLDNLIQDFISDSSLRKSVISKQEVCFSFHGVQRKQQTIQFPSSILFPSSSKPFHYPRAHAIQLVDTIWLSPAMNLTGLSLKTHEGRLLVSEVPKAQLRGILGCGNVARGMWDYTSILGGLQPFRGRLFLLRFHDSGCSESRNMRKNQPQFQFINLELA